MVIDFRQQVVARQGQWQPHFGRAENASSSALFWNRHLRPGENDFGCSFDHGHGGSACFTAAGAREVRFGSSLLDFPMENARQRFAAASVYQTRTR